MSFNLFDGKRMDKPRRKEIYRLSFTLHGIQRRYFMDKSQTIVVGRSTECDIVVPSPEVAPRHCRIESTSQGQLLLFSENNDNPTLVNGFPIPFKTLESGDRVKVGSLVLQISSKVRFFSGKAQSGPVVGYQYEFGDLFLQSLKRSPWVAISLVLHLALIFFLSHLLDSKELLGEPPVGIVQGVLSEPVPVVDLEDTPPLENFKALEADLVPPSPLLAPEYIESPLVQASESNELRDQKGALPRGGGNPAVFGDVRFPVLLRRSAGQPTGDNKKWKEHVGRLQTTGMDIAILFDSTGSMEGFILEVKETIKEMVQVLQSIVPDVSMCLMTYKGDPRSSDYTVAYTPLCQDPYELLNFMGSVDISGGSAEGYAAVATALDKACKSLSWRSGTEKLLVIIGDAPPFPDELTDCLQSIRSFEGRVASIYKPSHGATLMMEPETVSAFRKFSDQGNGPFIRIQDHFGVTRRIVSTILGTQWENNIEAEFDLKESGRWQSVISRKRQANDLTWFLKQFTKDRVRSEVIDGLMELDEAEVAMEMVHLAVTEEQEPIIIQRIFYVLQTMTGLEINYMTSPRDQITRGQMRYIMEYLKHLYGPARLKKIARGL